MFKRTKEKPRPKTRAKGGLSQYGLFEVPDIDNMTGMENAEQDNDDDLEAELLALTADDTPKPPKRVRPPPVPKANLDAMVAESMKEIPSDEELSGDDDDPELLAELSELQGDEAEPAPVAPAPAPSADSPASGGSLVSVLEERLRMYQEAEKNAKAANESSRARRFGRGIKTLMDQLKAARAGRVVNEEDIPPPVAVKLHKPADVPPATDQDDVAPPPDAEPAPDSSEPTPDSSEPAPPAAVVDPGLLDVLTTRRDQYKLAALKFKKAGDSDMALKCIRTAKQFELVLAAVSSGQSVDLSQMPPPPSELDSVTAGGVAEPRRQDTETQNASDPQPPAPDSQPAVDGPPAMDETELFKAPPPPASVMEALEQRLAKYRGAEQAAKEEGNSGKARRMGRIVKQYENAVRLHKAGKPIPVDELPTPPGFAPIPVPGVAAPPPPPPVTPPQARPVPPSPRPPRAEPESSPSSSRSSGSPAASPAERANVRKSPQSRQEKQLAFLQARQKEFKLAALQAKQKGEINQAKEYLRLAKGFDPLIEASNCGLPVDMATVPVPPDSKVVLESDFDIVTVDDCIPGSDAEIFEKLEEDLLKQAKMCLTTRDHFKAIGDVASANRFEQLALHAKKDLNAVQCAHRRSEAIPKFHYETKTFSIVQCCTDLGDNDLELTIIRGINYTVSNPKDVDTYVKFEFPYPSEDPPKDRTAVVKDTNNPEYNQVFPLTIARSSRTCQRMFKRHGIKLEVWSKGSWRHCMYNAMCCCCVENNSKPETTSGFLRYDTLIGTATVKLQPLETKCIIHDSFDLLEGRKPVGGKLEVKVRVRNPIVIKQVEQVQEKWLVIDHW
ncbi:coiled-coil and C2 domain-containing protein 1-like isoform X2 [Bacillus rossius redtenbacheri]|uniref:coiled-coil and C2 domain-containing protein 1-like isoform X2 n=1 Tax=Bacillus rossius redtenbacheri TaxID=93214 RepID=UPI002FDEF1D5